MLKVLSLALLIPLKNEVRVSLEAKNSATSYSLVYANVLLNYCYCGDRGGPKKNLLLNFRG